MGRWNGVGGKLDPLESPYDCIVRETHEETGLLLPQYVDRGVMRWFRDGADLGGVHIFTAEILPQEMAAYPTPKAYCHEGILDWKHIDWLLHPDNSGVVDNVKIMLQHLFDAGPDSVWISTYDKQVLRSCTYSTRSA